MDVCDIAVTILAWLCAFDSFQNLCSVVLYIAQFLFFTSHLSGYINTLRELRLVLLASALDELHKEASVKDRIIISTGSCSESMSQESRARTLLRIELDLKSLQKLVRAYGANPVWSIVYGVQLDSLLAGFEALLGPPESMINSPPSWPCSRELEIHAVATTADFFYRGNHNCNCLRHNVWYF